MPYEQAFPYPKWLAHLERLIGPVPEGAREMYEANLSVVEAAELLRKAA
ncbi:hypothetical protein LMG28138_01836 [Pararobbsia alpina]|uniref:Uncharacterized protein n=1 Tax=Pararobbsia alpina TaxID=621374 RepID=A0A6S7CPE6_9BURK|nr:hypothetical protein LMG28138_01836 [Pararobbsia alpina]